MTKIEHIITQAKASLDGKEFTLSSFLTFSLVKIPLNNYEACENKGFSFCILTQNPNLRQRKFSSLFSKIYSIPSVMDRQDTNRLAPPQNDSLAHVCSFLYKCKCMISAIKTNESLDWSFMSKFLKLSKDYFEKIKKTYLFFFELIFETFTFFLSPQKNLLLSTFSATLCCR